MKHKYLIVGLFFLLACQESGLPNDVYRMAAWSSMEPLIQTGDSLTLLAKDGYARNEVVGMLQKETETDSLILIPARVVGLPGETLKMEEGQIYIDGQLYKDPFEVNLPYLVWGKTIDSSLFETYNIKRYSWSMGDYWKAHLNKLELAKIESDPRVGQVILTLSNIFGVDPVVGRTDENNWTKINWGPIKIPKVGEKVVLKDANRSLYRPLFFEEKKKNVVPIECYFLINDDRASSYDSRYLGLVPKWAIIGAVDISGLNPWKVDIELFPQAQP